MAGTRSVEAELGALRSEMERAASRRAEPADEAAPSSAGPDAEPAPSVTDFSAALEDLKRLIGDYAGSAEEVAADHPFAVAGAAFLLGFSLGRLSK